MKQPDLSGKIISYLTKESPRVIPVCELIKYLYQDPDKQPITANKVIHVTVHHMKRTMKYPIKSRLGKNGGYWLERTEP
jgi:hypothetical protein